MQGKLLMTFNVNFGFICADTLAYKIIVTITYTFTYKILVTITTKILIVLPFPK